jgi:hypothetical protein
VNASDLTSGTGDLAELLAMHLEDEEAVLAAAVPILRALKAALLETREQKLPDLVERHRAVADLLSDVKIRRERFRAQLARRLQCDAETITVSRVLQRLPAGSQDTLGACIARIRDLAEEFVTINRWLTIHLRIHLNAYQRLLCDLTGSARSSGRYGPAGRAEAGNFRPLIQIQG